MDNSNYTLWDSDVKKGERPGCTDRGAGGKEGEQNDTVSSIYYSRDMSKVIATPLPFRQWPEVDGEVEALPPASRVPDRYRCARHD